MHVEWYEYESLFLHLSRSAIVSVSKRRLRLLAICEFFAQFKLFCTNSAVKNPCFEEK